MFKPSTNQQSPHSEELATHTGDALPDDRAVGAAPEQPRSRTTEASPRVSRPWPPARPSKRPRGHVVGRAFGDPQPPSSAGRPRGHVVGHALGDPPPALTTGRPRGHVVGHALSGPPPPLSTGRPRGHVVGHACGGAIRRTR